MSVFVVFCCEFVTRNNTSVCRLMCDHTGRLNLQLTASQELFLNVKGFCYTAGSINSLEGEVLFIFLFVDHHPLLCARILILIHQI